MSISKALSKKADKKKPKGLAALRDKIETDKPTGLAALRDKKQTQNNNQKFSLADLKKKRDKIQKQVSKQDFLRQGIKFHNCQQHGTFWTVDVSNGMNTMTFHNRWGSWMSGGEDKGIPLPGISTPSGGGYEPREAWMAAAMQTRFLEELKARKIPTAEQARKMKEEQEKQEKREEAERIKIAEEREKLRQQKQARKAAKGKR